MRYLLSIILIFLLSINCKSNDDKLQFSTGQVLYPDYACPDTLIVLDGPKLTKEMNNLLNNPIYGSDADIDSVLHRSCRPLESIK